MTRDEFLESVNDWWELKDFCSEIGCEYCDSIIDDDGLDEEVEYALGEYLRDYNWREIRDMLGDIPTGYNWYRCDGSFDYVGLDDSDFEDVKDEVYEWAFNNGYFDDDEEEGEEYDDATEPEFCDETEEDPVEEEDFSVSDLMGMCSVTLVTIQTDNLRRVQEEAAAFNRLIDANIPKVIR